MKDIRKFYKNDRFAKYLGIELIEVSEGKARARLKIR